MADRLTTEQFIEKANSIHDNKYDYSLTTYVNAKTKVVIVCSKHGQFLMTPNNHTHKSNPQGCPICALESKANSSEQFIEKAKKVHGNFYDYSLVDYKNSFEKITIICPIHGEFLKIPYNHTSNKQGCPKCGKQNSIGNRPKLTNEEFIKKSNLIHGNKYNYDKTSYTVSRNKVIITCALHGDFRITPNNHLRGKGCIKCASSGFDPSKPAILYYLSINNGQAYKIGITNRSVELRFTVSDLNCITKLFQINLDGELAKTLEHSILKKYVTHSYKGEPLLSSGNTELFSINIFANNPELFENISNEEKITILNTILQGGTFDSTILLGN